MNDISLVPKLIFCYTLAMIVWGFFLFHCRMGVHFWKVFKSKSNSIEPLRICPKCKKVQIKKNIWISEISVTEDFVFSKTEPEQSPWNINLFSRENRKRIRKKLKITF